MASKDHSHTPPQKKAHPASRLSDAILVLYPPSPFGLSCTLKCDPVPRRVVHVLVLSSCCTPLAVIKSFVLTVCLFVCLLLIVCFRQKEDSAFSKIRIKQLKHHLILTPNSQRLYPIYRWLPEAVRGPPATGPPQPLMQEYSLMGRTLLRKNRK